MESAFTLGGSGCPRALGPSSDLWQELQKNDHPSHFTSVHRLDYTYLIGDYVYVRPRCLGQVYGIAITRRHDSSYVRLDRRYKGAFTLQNSYY
ncbi:hypothetical protein HA402_007692 [Bradysia odoriphaga]|nr:hypothetical protein HA402_007692 [Bradysia odoriphaga]